MKDLKYTLKRSVQHAKGTKALWKMWTARLWRKFLLLAVTAALCATALLYVSADVLQPVMADGARWADVMTARGIAWTIALVLSAPVAVWASVVAHRAMKKVVGQYARNDMSQGRRRLLMAEAAAIVITACWVAALPVIVVFVSALAARQSAMAADVVVTPMWVPTCYFLAALLGMLTVEIVLTFVRMAFRQLPETIPSTNDNESPDNEQENDTDSHAHADGTDGHGIATAAKDGQQTNG